MKSLIEMSNAQLTYLKQKWSAEARELDRSIIRSQERLNTRIDKQVINQEELKNIKQQLANAQLLLTHLQSTTAPTEMIENQQAVVDALQTQVDKESKGTNVLTDEEAVIQQASIDELKLQKEYRESKIEEIDGLLAA